MGILLENVCQKISARDENSRKEKVLNFPELRS